MLPNQVISKTLALNTLREATELGIQVENVVADPVFTGRAEGRAVGLARMFWKVRGGEILKNRIVTPRYCSASQFSASSWTSVQSQPYGGINGFPIPCL